MSIPGGQLSGEGGKVPHQGCFAATVNGLPWGGHFASHGTDHYNVAPPLHRPLWPTVRPLLGMALLASLGVIRGVPLLVQGLQYVRQQGLCQSDGGKGVELEKLLGDV